MRGRSAVILAFLMVAVLALAGCGDGAGAAGGQAGNSSKSDLEGIWKMTKFTDGDPSTAGISIKFEGDIAIMGGTDEVTDGTGGGRYRFVLLDDTQMTLTPIVSKDGLEFDDPEKMLTKHYKLEGDTLTLESYGTYERTK